MVRNKALNGLAWGAFIILIGAGWLAGDYYQIDTGPYVAFGVGLILIGLNTARSGFGLRISNFSLFIGIIAFAIGSWNSRILSTSYPNNCDIDRSLHNS